VKDSPIRDTRTFGASLAISICIRMIQFQQKQENAMQTDDRRVIWYGLLLFLLGVLIGFAEHSFYGTNISAMPEGRKSWA
jgi:hypothetical protein